MSGVPRSRWVRVGLTFACFEGLMPIVGLLVGQRLGTLLGEIAGYFAAAMLIVIGGREIREAVLDAGDDDEAFNPSSSPEERRPLLLLSLSVSLDELAVG